MSSKAIFTCSFFSIHTSFNEKLLKNEVSQSLIQRFFYNKDLVSCNILFFSTKYLLMIRNGNLLRDRRQLLLLLLNKSINFYSPRNHQKTCGSPMMSGRIDVNSLKIAKLETKFGNDP